MIASMVLLAYAALLAGIVAPRLRAARWVEHAPGWGLAAWIALAWSLVLSVALAVLVLCLQLPSSAAQLYRATALCLQALGGSLGVPAALVAALSLTGLIAGAVRLIHMLARQWWRTTRRRYTHRQALRLLGRTDDSLGAVVLDDHRPTAYCIPGGHGHVVLTTAAVDRLTPAQLQSVLAHERAHLRGRHALLIAAGTLPAHLLPLRALQHAACAVTRLVEYTADDTASHHTDRLALAEALLTLGTPTPSPTSTLAATAIATPARITRLLDESGGRQERSPLAAPTAIAIAIMSVPFLLAVSSTYLGGAWNACLFGLAFPC